MKIRAVLTIGLALAMATFAAASAETIVTRTTLPGGGTKVVSRLVGAQRPAPRGVNATVPPLAVTKAVTSHTVGAGAEFFYTFTITNTGLTPSGSIVVDDGPDFNAAVLAGKISPTIHCTVVGFPPGSGATLAACATGGSPSSAQYSVDNLNAGQSISFLIGVTPLVAGSTISDQGQVFSNCSLNPVPVTVPCGVAQGVTDDPSTAPLGDPTVVTVTAFTAAIPTLSAVGLSLLILLLAAVGFVVVRRRGVSA